MGEWAVGRGTLLPEWPLGSALQCRGALALWVVAWKTFLGSVGRSRLLTWRRIGSTLLLSLLNDPLATDLWEEEMVWKLKGEDGAEPVAYPGTTGGAAGGRSLDPRHPCLLKSIPGAVPFGDCWCFSPINSWGGFPFKCPA